MERRDRSAKVRTTERVAELVGFEYEFVKFKYGGYFSLFQMEQIANKITHLQRELETERREKTEEETEEKIEEKTEEKIEEV